MFWANVKGPPLVNHRNNCWKIGQVKKQKVIPSAFKELPKSLRGALNCTILEEKALPLC